MFFGVEGGHVGLTSVLKTVYRQCDKRVFLTGQFHHMAAASRVISSSSFPLSLSSFSSSSAALCFIHPDVLVDAMTLYMLFMRGRSRKES